MNSKSDAGDRLHSLYEQDGGVAGAFSAKADDYSSSRPGYPDALFEALASTCRLSADAVVVDLGAGTGLLTRGFLRKGYRVVAVEPNAAMRQSCDDLLGRFPNYRSVDGSAESMPLATSSADLITAAQAFHWFRIEEARTECLRVLKPEGNVALIWNDRVHEDAVHVALNAIFAEFGGAKREALAAHEKDDGVVTFFGKTTPMEFSWPNEQLLEEKGLVSLVLSRSYMPARDSDAGREVEVRAREVFDRLAKDGVLAVRYTTVARVGRPNPPHPRSLSHGEREE